MTRVLIWCSFNRSGTNHLTDLLWTIPGLTSMTEVFEPSSVQVHSFQDQTADVLPRIFVLYQAFGIAMPGTTDLNRLMQDPALIAAVHADPGRTLDILRDSSADPAISLKLFPGHLPPRDVAELLRRPDVIPCLFLRNPLDTWISVLKRRQSGAFRGADTTAIRPRVGFQGYLDYLERRAEWLRGIGVTDRQFAIKLSYEDLIAQPSDGDRIRGLRRSLSAIGLDAGPAPPHPFKASPIQDRAATIDDKIANWPELSRRCRDAGLDPWSDLIAWPDMDDLPTTIKDLPAP